MRVDPNYLNNVVSSLDNVTGTVQSLTQEISTGVRVNSLSSDPIASGENVLLNSQINLDASFAQTASSTESMLQVSDSALGSVVSQLTSAISLATQANNGTLNASNVKSIATQLSGIRDEVLSLANTTYLGQYVFSGSQGSTAPYTLDNSVSPAVATYHGDSAVSYVQTPNGQKIQLNVPGNEIFSSAGNDVLGTLNSLVADFSSGTASATSVTDTTQLSQVLNFVSHQRVTIDNSITRLKASASYSQTESTQLQSEQTNLMQADVAQVSTQLSTAESQQVALTQILAQLGKTSLFNSL